MKKKSTSSKQYPQKKGQRILEALEKTIRETPKSAWSNWSSHTQR